MFLFINFLDKTIGEWFTVSPAMKIVSNFEHLKIGNKIENTDLVNVYLFLGLRV